MCVKIVIEKEKRTPTEAWTNKMEIKEAVKQMEDLQDNFICVSSQLDIAIMNYWEGQKAKAIEDISRIRKRSKKIYDKFKDGCRGDVDCYGYTNFDGGWECGQQYLNKEIISCPNCKEIKKIHDAILGEPVK